MALPKNTHHVHSDGYYSDKGEPDRQRMLEELADDIGIHPNVSRAEVGGDVDGMYVYVEVTDEYSSTDVQKDSEKYGCTVVDGGDDWLEVRPE